MKRILLYAVIALTLISAGVAVSWLFWALQFPAEHVGQGGIILGLAINAGLFILFAALHSLLARGFITRPIGRLLGDRYVRPIFILVTGITIPALMALWRPLPGALWRVDGAGYWVLTALYVLFILGAAYAGSFIVLDISGIRALIRDFNGQPQPRPIFSTGGLHGYCRHPMYVFFILAFWTGPVMTLGRAEFALFGTLYLVFGSLLEERNLRERLGEVYELYRANVPMWVPRLRPWMYREPTPGDAPAGGSPIAA